MIITLVKANFSASNIGTLDSFAVLTNLGPGFDYNGPVFAIKGGSLEASVSLNSNCTLKHFDVTMGGKSLSDAYVINDNVITINISKVTGIVVITGSAEGDVTVPDVWYIDSLNALADSGIDLVAKGTSLAGGTGYTPWAYDANFNSKLVNRTINAIEIFPSASGKFSVGKVNATTFEYTTIDSFTIDEADINTRKIYTFTPFVVNEGEFFTFNADGDSGKGYYYWTKDVSGIEGVTQLYSNCDSGAMGDFVHAIIPGFNIGYKSGVVEDTPENPPVEPENPPVVEPEFPDTPAVDGNTTWYIQSLKQLQDSGNDLSKKVKLQSGGSSYSWAFQESMNNKLVGKTLNTLEMVPQSTGDFYVGKYDTNTKTVTEKRKVTISEVDTPVTLRFDDLTINEGEFFVWNCLGTAGEAIGYYIMKANVDPLVVETSGWYQAKSSGLTPFGTYELAYIANIGYTTAE